MFNNATDVLSVLDAKGHTVATLQFDSSVSGDTFGVTSFGTDGGTQIRLADPNFAPLITGTNTGAITENAHPPVETLTANLAFSDAVPGNLYSYTLKMEGDPPLGSLSVDPHVGPPLVLNSTVDNLLGSGGELGLDYSVSDSALNFLQAGEIKTDTFDLELSDGHATYTEPYAVTITGTNEAPVIGNIDLSTTAFSTVGGASVSSALHPDDTTGGNLYNLLPDATSQPGSPAGALGQAGAIWQQVNLNENFSVHAGSFSERESSISSVRAVVMASPSRSRTKVRTWSATRAMASVLAVPRRRRINPRSPTLSALSSTPITTVNTSTAQTIRLSCNRIFRSSSKTATMKCRSLARSSC